MDMQLELLIHDFERINIVSKVHDDVNFKEEVKSKYACEEVKEKHSEKEGPVGFLENAESFHKKKSSHSSIHNQTDEVIENQCTDFVFESSSGGNFIILGESTFVFTEFTNGRNVSIVR